MPTKTDHLRALDHICRQFGGRLVVMALRDFDSLFTTKTDNDLCMAPFTNCHGLHWRDKIIYTVKGHEQIGAIIHEMGHVFAASHPPLCSKDHACPCHEWNWLGWEITLARQISALRTWSQQNADYGTDDGGGLWGALSTKQRRAVLANRLAHAQKLSLISTAGEPRSLR